MRGSREIVLNYITENPGLHARLIAEGTGLSYKAVNCRIVVLRDEGLIENRGSTSGGSTGVGGERRNAAEWHRVEVKPARRVASVFDLGCLG